MLDAWHSDELDCEAPPENCQRGLGNREIAASPSNAETALFQNPRAYRSDLRLLLQALNQGWDAPDVAKQEAIHAGLWELISEKKRGAYSKARVTLRACWAAVKMGCAHANTVSIILGERVEYPRMLTPSQRELRAALHRNPALRQQAIQDWREATLAELRRDTTDAFMEADTGNDAAREKPPA